MIQTKMNEKVLSLCHKHESVTDVFYGCPRVDVFNVLKQRPVEGDAIVTRALVTGNLLDNTNTQIFWL